MKQETNYTLQIINEVILDLLKDNFTGSLTINFHKGDISKKIEKRMYEFAEARYDRKSR